MSVATGQYPTQSSFIVQQGNVEFGQFIGLNFGPGISLTDQGTVLGVAVFAPTVVLPALDVDWSLSGTYSKTLAAGANAITFSNTADGETIVVELTSDAGGSTVTWPGSVTWAGGVAPVQTTPSGTDVYTFVRIGDAIRGTALQAFA